MIEIMMNKHIVVFVFIIILQVYSLKLRVFFDGGCKSREKNLSGGACVAYKYEYNNNANNDNENMMKAFHCQYFYGRELHYNSHIIEYLSLINAVQAIKYYIHNTDDINHIELLGDSAIVINHLKNKYDKKKDFYLQQYHSLASSLLESINTKLELIHIPRENNTEADLISNVAMNELTSESHLPTIYEGSLLIMKVDPVNEQFRSIYHNMELEIGVLGIKTVIIPNNVENDNMRVIDVINAHNCSSIKINNLDFPLYNLQSNIEFPVNINTKYFGQVPPINISMLHVSLTTNESILKAVIDIISLSGIYSEQSFTYIFTCLLHSIQRRNLLSILNTKVLIQVSNINNRKFCSVIEGSCGSQLNSNDKIYLASPLQVSLLLGNMKSSELLVSIVGKNAFQDSINNEAGSLNYISDEAAAEIGGNIRNKKLIKEFIMKTM